MHSPVDYFQCFCDKHLELYSELLGEAVTIEKMREELQKSEPSKYREAWLGGKPLTAICAGHPDLYLMVKTNADSMAIGLWNYFADKIRQPEIELGETYSSAEFINCEGKLEGNKVVISSTLYAYEFCFVCLKK